MRRRQPPPAPKAKPSIGKRIGSAAMVLIGVIAAKAVVGGLFHHHGSSGGDEPLFDYAVGTCLKVDTTIMVKPGDVHELPCSSPDARVIVAKKYTGQKNCPTEEYATLEGGGGGLCLQDDLAVGTCYQQGIVTHLFEPTGCTPGFTEPTVRVALRRDGVDDPGLCGGDQQPLNYPEPPLTYCLEVIGTTG
ncbi:LppU/SCO3897 family protein [Mycobacterium talmoniae]|nr:hypothetical protein [Mycobacterium talmoniae]